MPPTNESTYKVVQAMTSGIPAIKYKQFLTQRNQRVLRKDCKSSTGTGHMSVILAVTRSNLRFPGFFHVGRSFVATQLGMRSDLLKSHMVLRDTKCYSPGVRSSPDIYFTLLIHEV